MAITKETIGAGEAALPLETTLGVVASNALRSRIYVSLAQQVDSSATQLKNALSVPHLSTVKYHLKKLEKVNLVEFAGDRPTRSGTERYYRVIARPFIADVDWAELPLSEREASTRYVLLRHIVDFSLAVDQGTFNRRLNNSLLRVPLAVDDEGFAELNAIAARGLPQRLEVAAASADRISERARKGEDKGEIPAVSMIMFFEAGIGGGEAVAQLDDSFRDLGDPTSRGFRDVSRPEFSLETTLGVLLSHPLRTRIFTALTERAASATQLEKVFRVSRDSISHHIKKLEGIGVVEFVGSRPVNGSSEHFYRACARPLIDDDSFAAMTPQERDAFTRYVLLLHASDFSLAFDQGTFERRTNRALLRTPMVVDEEGFATINAIERKELPERLNVGEKSKRRMDERESRGEDRGEIRAVSTSMFFEAALEPGELDGFHAECRTALEAL